MGNQDEREGSLIVVEGPDASGKETQVGRIVKWLRENDHTNIKKHEEERLRSRMPGSYPSRSSKIKDNITDGVWRLSFPTYSQTPGGRVVKSYLNGELGSRDSLDVNTIVDIYAADRKQFKHVMDDYLCHGGIVVCDRYWQANLIHQLVDFPEHEWESKMEDIKSADSDLPNADEVFYLDISPEKALSRMQNRNKDIHELDEDYLRKSNLNGTKVAQTENWKVINSDQEIDKVTQELKEQVQHILTK